MSAYRSIPRTVLMGRVSHLKAEHRKMSDALRELVTATDARRAIPHGEDRAAATARVIRAYNTCRTLVLEPAPTKLKKPQPQPQPEPNLFNGLLPSDSLSQAQG
jgi:hypothetical protein